MVDAAKVAHTAANEVFKSGDYHAAAEAYTAALAHLPVTEAQPVDSDEDPRIKATKAHEVTLLSNRAECYLRIAELSLAQLDVDRALALDPNHAKTIKRRGRVAERRHAIELAKAQAMAARNIKMHQTVMKVQEQLIDGVESLAQLAELGSQINPPHFFEVVEERVHSLGVCGYPICSRPVKKIQPGKLVLSPQKGQIFETVQAMYCSTRCKHCSQDFVRSLPETPVVIAADSTPVVEPEIVATRAKQDQPQPQHEHKDPSDAARTGRQERVAKIEIVERSATDAVPSHADTCPQPRTLPQPQRQPPPAELEPEPEPEPETETEFSDQIGFVPADSFRGVRAGSVYKLGKQGLGYYRDLGVAAGETARSEPQPLKKQKNGNSNISSKRIESAAVTTKNNGETKQAGKEGKRAREVVPKVSPFLGTYYTLQQWCNPTSVRAFVAPASSTTPEHHAEQRCGLAYPAQLGELENEVCESLQRWMSQTCQELGLTDLVASSASEAGATMSARLASFAACAGAAGGLDYNGSHGCHALLLPQQWQAICLAIGAVRSSVLYLPKPRRCRSPCLSLHYALPYLTFSCAWSGVS